MEINTRAIVATLLFIFAHTHAQQSPAEDDWSLPSWVTRTTNSGYYGGYDGGANFPDLEQAKIVWRMICPTEGVYDWSSVDKQFNATTKRLWVRFFASDTSHCPRWLRTKYANLRVLRYRWPDDGYDDIVGYMTGSGTVRSAGDFYEIWDPRFETEYRAFLKQFKTRYGSNDRIVFSYYPHAWRWCEWSLKWIPEMVASGFTPQQFVEWFKRTTADYIDAFNGKAGKLVYTGGGEDEWIEWPGNQTASDAWKNAINVNGGNVMSQYAMTQGCGVRNGFTEVFNHFAAQPDWGLSLKTIGANRYSVIDEANPLISSTERFFGTENEDFSYMWEPECNSYYYIKTMYLVTLRLRMNWVFAGQYSLAPAIMEYAAKTMGKHVYDSPDAWVALRQYKDSNIDNTENIRNFERWLYQRDVEADGRTKPAHRINYPSDFASSVGSAGSYEALSTDHATGSDNIYFNVDDGFIKGGPLNVQIKVTYLDNFTGNWWVEYDAAGTGSATKKASTVTNINDGKWKTATIAVADAGFSNRQSGGNDLRINNGGVSDLTVRFVRVVKVNKPGTVPGRRASAPALRTGDAPAAFYTIAGRKIGWTGADGDIHGVRLGRISAGNNAAQAYVLMPRR